MLISINQYITEKLRLNKETRVNCCNSLSELVEQYKLIPKDVTEDDIPYQICWPSEIQYNKIIEKVKTLENNTIKGILDDMMFEYDYVDIDNDKNHKYIAITIGGKDNSNVEYDYSIVFAYNDSLRGIGIDNNIGTIMKCKQFDYVEPYLTKLIESIINI